ncbi:MAG: hypothetical protein ABF655_10955 [Liquorilactobacillus satsumensis]|uniref:hypothetical protein n=1 Tax=Liquorilactobacillus satsumensis TaxID=259059 RepID=UPI0039E84B79
MDINVELEKFIRQIVDINGKSPIKKQIKDIEKHYQIDNMEEILYELSHINKPVIQKYLNDQKTVKYKNHNYPTHNKFSNDDIENLFRQSNVASIKEKYTKNDIVDMYITIFNAKPLSANTKEQTIRDIYSYYSGINRTKSLHRGFSFS